MDINTMGGTDDVCEVIKARYLFVYVCVSAYGALRVRFS